MFAIILYTFKCEFEFDSQLLKLEFVIGLQNK